MTTDELLKHLYAKHLLHEWSTGSLRRIRADIDVMASIEAIEALNRILDYLNNEKADNEYILQCIKCSSPTIGMYASQARCYKRLVRINKIISYINEAKSRISA